MSRPDARSTRRSWLRASLAAPLSALIGRTPVAAAQAEPPRARIRDRHFPDVLLRTHEDRVVRFYEDLIKDRVVIINFMYTQCEGICPGITMNLVRLQKLLGPQVGRDVFMYSISLDPEHDTPQALAAYMHEHGVEPGWTFLTGHPADIERLRQALGFVDPNPEKDRDRESHIGNIRYGNERLMLWAACPGMADPKWIAESLAWVRR